MKSTLASLKQYQDILTRIAELEKLLADVPEEVQSLQNEWTSFEETAKELESRKNDLGVKIRDLSGQLQDAETKSKKFDEDLKAVRNDREYNAVIKEIETVKKKLTGLKEELGSLKTELHEVESNLDESQEKASSFKAQYEAAHKEHLESLAHHQVELGEKNGAKQALVVHIPQRLIRLFDRIAVRRNGVAVATCARGICNACNVRVRQSMVDRLRTYSSVIQCESCQRILFFEEETEG